MKDYAEVMNEQDLWYLITTWDKFYLGKFENHLEVIKEVSKDGWNVINYHKNKNQYKYLVAKLLQH